MSVCLLKTGNTVNQMDLMSLRVSCFDVSLLCSGSFSPLRSPARAVSLKQPSLTFKPARWQNYLGASSRCRNTNSGSPGVFLLPHIPFPSTSFAPSSRTFKPSFIFSFNKSQCETHMMSGGNVDMLRVVIWVFFLKSFSLKNDKNAGCCCVVAVVINIFLKSSFLYKVQP